MAVPTENVNRYRSFLYLTDVITTEVSQRETGRFTRGVETVGVHPFFAPAA